MSRIVAIVGRPNVGKSTIFNRILGSRHAIVHDQPGVTRDRLYANTDWAGKSFTIIDTGGYVPKSKDVFEKAIREQAEISIEEADVVVFVVDAVSGLTPLDIQIADILRKAKKKVYLVANKIDSERKEVGAAEFFKLGFGNPIILSALLGRMVGDFLDKITESFAKDEDEASKDKRLKIAIVGRPNVGKSSLVNALLGKQRNIVTDIPGTTRDSIDSVLMYKNEEIILIDTAGLRRKARVKESIEYYSTLRALKSIDQCDVAIMLVDAQAGMDKQDLKILERIAEHRRGTLLAVNKWDLIEKDSQTAKAFEQSLKAYLRIYDYVPIIFISALKKIRVPNVIEQSKKIHAEQTKRIATNILNRILLKEIELHPPSSRRGKDIKINYITQVKTAPPAFSIFSNFPEEINENYKRFLERKMREHFGFVGVPITFYFQNK